MSKIHKTFTEICTRLDIKTASEAESVGMTEELIEFLWPVGGEVDTTTPVEIIAQIAKFTGTRAGYWVDMERDDTLAKVEATETDFIGMYRHIHLPLEPKHCLFCGCERISYFRTLQFKACLDCQQTEPFNLKPDQEPLLGPSRNIKRGDS